MTRWRGLRAKTAALLAVVAAVTTCGRPSYAPHPQPPLSPSHSQGIVIRRPLAFEEAQATRHEVPLPRSGDGLVLAGDVHGRIGSEIVVVERAGVAVFGSDGRLLARAETDEPVLAAGVLADVDRDGRADIVTGVAGGADPLIRVFNGRGKEIMRRRFEADGRSFGAVRPAALSDDALYVVASENWIRGPRGVIRLSLSRLETVWFSAVPTDLTGIAIAGDRVLASNATQDNGEFVRIGVDGETRFGFDATPRLLVLDADGSPRVERALSPPNPAGTERAWLLPTGPETLVAHLALEQERLVLADAASGEVFDDRGADGRVRQLVSFPTSPGVGFATVTDDAGRWRIATASAIGEVLATREGTDARPRLLALLAGEAEPRSFLAIVDGRLATIGVSDGPVGDVEVPTTISGSVVVTWNEDELLVAGLGTSLELVTIPFAPGQTAPAD